MSLNTQVIVDNIKPAGDVISISVILGTLANWLPAVAALISIVWGLIRIFESKTVQRWCGYCLKHIGRDKDEHSPKG